MNEGRTLIHIHAGITDGDVKAYLEMFPEARPSVLYCLDPGSGIDPNGLLKLRDEGKVAQVFLDNGNFARNYHGRLMEPRSAKLANFEYLRHFGPDFDRVFGFDEDFQDVEHNMGVLESLRLYLQMPCDPEDPERQARLARLADEIIPVVHEGEKAHEEFTYYRELGYGYIAIGSNADIPPDKLDLIQADRYRCGIKMHLLGVSSWPRIMEVCPDSVDSSIFAKATSFGTLMLRFDDSDPEKACIREVVMQKSGSSKIQEEWDEAMHPTYLESVGLNYSRADLVGDAVKRRVCNLYAIEQMTAWVNRVKMPAHRALYPEVQG